MPNTVNWCSLLLLLFWLSTAQSAQNILYIVDSTQIPMYQKADVSSKVLKTLPKTAEIEAINQARSGWSKVRYLGQTGWIESRFLSVQPNDEIKLNQLKKLHFSFKQKHQKLVKENEFLRQTNKEVTEKLQGIQRDYYEANQSVKRLTNLVKEPLAVEEKNKYYRQELEALKVENELLRFSEYSHERSKDRNWFWLLIFCSLTAAVLSYIMGGYFAKRRRGL